MPCYRPLTGYRSKDVNPTGKRSIVFSKRESLDDGLVPLVLPCGQCLYCRLEHSRNYAIRASHEASLYEKNCFLTLTYSPEHLPPDGSLDYEAAPNFMKSLRHKFGPGIRSFGCAEYGEQKGRPHFHIALFNFDFTDKSSFDGKRLQNPWSTHDEHALFTSKTLTDLWPYGHASIGSLTFESAAYIARYVTKKITGKRAESHYECEPDPVTGEIRRLLPERSICVSRMPGLGRDWFDRNVEFLLNNDYVISRGRKVPLPKYYDRLLEKLYPERYKEIKLRRRENATDQAEKLLAEDHKAMIAYFNKHDALEHGVPMPEPRLYVMERVHELQTKTLIRNLENG